MSFDTSKAALRARVPAALVRICSVAPAAATSWSVIATTSFFCVLSDGCLDGSTLGTHAALPSEAMSAQALVMSLSVTIVF
jgi:hypothetical protein